MTKANSLDITKSLSLTMSSREISDICGARHNDVVTTIERLFENGVLRESRKTTRAHRPDKGGRPTEVYDLTKRDTLVVVSGYNDDVRAKIIDRWLELEEGNYNPTRPTKTRRPSVFRTFNIAMKIGERIGLEKAQLAFHASQYCEAKCGENPLKLMGVKSLAAPRDEHTMTPRQIGKELGGVSAQIVNDKLLALGFQTYTLDGKGHRVYRLTEAGKPFGRLEDTSRAHTQGAVTVVRWYPDVVDALRTQPRSIPQLERAATREVV